MTETIYEKLDQIEQEAARIEPLDLDALRYLQMVYRGQVQAEGPGCARLMACFQYETPQLSVVASMTRSKCLRRTTGAANRRSGVSPRVIEQHPVIQHQPEPGDVTGLACDRAEGSKALKPHGPYELGNGSA